MADEHVEKVEEGHKPEEVVENVTPDPKEEPIIDRDGDGKPDRIGELDTRVSALEKVIAGLTAPVEEIVSQDASPVTKHFLFR